MCRVDNSQIYDLTNLMVKYRCDANNGGSINEREFAYRCIRARKQRQGSAKEQQKCFYSPCSHLLYRLSR